jgi:polyphosphate:AMP phosphotransferase
MFEAAEIGHEISKEAYEAEVPALRQDLLAVQAELKKADFPVLIVVGGVDGAGKGETINKLLEWLDPRYVETSATSPSAEDAGRPAYYRFWKALPPRGKIGIFFGGWHTQPIVDRAYRRITDGEFDRQLAEVTSFERLIAADGALILKFWMHLSKPRQKRRLKALEKDAVTRWRVTAGDWERFAMYDRFAKVSSQALRRTSIVEAPWNVVEATDRRYQTLTVGRRVRDALRDHLATRTTQSKPAAQLATAPVAAASDVTILSTLDLKQAVDPDHYKEALEEAQGRLNRAMRRAYKKKHAAVVVFEGVDAAGKGGNIRRVTGSIDARAYRIVPIAAPTQEERRFPYLWRFWKHLPGPGQMTIFDRSWYGRVLVERVEGYCSQQDWQRAYTEINEFEDQMVRSNVALVKFWLHIDQDEQLKRFEDRAHTTFKQFKITDEDWRNRKKWPQYEQAINDMVERTSTEVAPWTLVEANDKKFARLKTLDTIAKALEAQ